MKTPSPKTIALLVRTIVGLVLLIGAGGLMAYLIATKPQVSKSDIDELSVGVQVMRVQPVEVARQWRGYGTTQAKDSADIPARIATTVVEIPPSIEVGQVVQAGQVIARLDATDFRNALRAADKRIAEADALVAQLDVEKARLEDRLKLEKRDVELARADYQRQLDRLERGSATQSDIDRVQRSLINAERALLATQQQLDAIAPRLAGLEATKGVALADRQNAEANLQRTVIASPISGVIEALDIEVGENLAPGQRVARVVDPRILELPLQLPASARSYVGTGNTAMLTTRCLPDDCPPWNAKITRLGVVNSPTRTFTAFAEVDQSHIALRNFAQGTGPYKLPAGAFTLAKLDTAEPQTQTILPARSIQEGRIRTVVDGQVVGKTVDVAFDLEGRFPQFGLEDTQWVVLKEPLAPGTLVILSASMTILEGQQVEPKVSNDNPSIVSEVSP